MTERLRLWAGWRTARRIAASRLAAARARSGVRRVVVLLPAAAEAQRAAWAFVAAIDAPVVPVVAADAVAVVPDAYAGDVVRLGPDAVTRLGGPRRGPLEALWAGTDVVVSLVPLDAPLPFALVAGAPAALRVGVDTPGAEGALDLAVGAGTADVPGRLLDVLRTVRPPVVPLRPAG